MKKSKNIVQILALLVYVLFLLVKMTGTLIPIDLYVISAFALGVGVLNVVFKSRSGGYVFNKELVLIWLFFFLAIISLVWTRAPSYGEEKLFILLSIYIISYFFCYLVVNRVDIFIKLMVLGVLGVVIWFFRTEGIETLTFKGRFTMIDEANSIVMSRYFCFSIIVLFFFIRSQNSKVLQFCAMGIVGILLVLAFATGSKGPLLSLFLSFIIVQIIGNRFKFRFSVGSILVIASMILVLSYFVLPLILGNGSSTLSRFIESRYYGQDALESVTSRLWLYDLVYKNIHTDSIFNFIFGNGIGDYGYLAYGGDIRMYPHNIVLEIFYELGLVGLLLFFIFIYKVVRINYKKRLRLFQNDTKNNWLCFFVTSFYFSLFVAMTTADIGGNYLVFVSFLLIVEAKRMLSGSIDSNALSGIVYRKKRILNLAKND